MTQNYVSNTLAHFVGRRLPDNDSRYDLLKHIIETGLLKPPQYDPNKSPQIRINPAKKISEDTMFYPDMVCFCDIPDSELNIHTAKYSKFGIAFHKDFLIKKGACPVFYIPLEAKIVPARSNQANPILSEDFNDMAKRVFFSLNAAYLLLLCLGQANVKSILIKAADFLVKNGAGLALDVSFTQKDIEDLNNNNYDLSKDLFLINEFLSAQIFSFVKFFDHTKPDDAKDNYYMEREWRVIGSVEFSVSDIVKIYLPREYGDKFQKDFNNIDPQKMIYLD